MPWQVGKGAIVAGDAVMLPHSMVEPRAIVGAMSVAGRPVKSDLQLVGIGLSAINGSNMHQLPTQTYSWCATYSHFK